METDPDPRFFTLKEDFSDDAVEKRRFFPVVQGQFQVHLDLPAFNKFFIIGIFPRDVNTQAVKRNIKNFTLNFQYLGKSGDNFMPGFDAHLLTDIKQFFNEPEVSQIGLSGCQIDIINLGQDGTLAIVRHHQRLVLLLQNHPLVFIHTDFNAGVIKTKHHGIIGNRHAIKLVDQHDGLIFRHKFTKNPVNSQSHFYPEFCLLIPSAGFILMMAAMYTPNSGHFRFYGSKNLNDKDETGKAYDAILMPDSHAGKFFQAGMTALTKGMAFANPP